MSESQPKPSAEKDYLINREAFELRVHRFIENPVATLREIHQELLVDSENYENVDVVGETYILIDEFKEFMYEHELVSTDTNLQNYFTYGNYSTEGDAGLFTLLKAAGYKKAEISTWLNFGMRAIPSEDQFMVRQSLAILNRIYEEN